VDECAEIKRMLKELLERVAVIEGMVEMVKEDLEELKKGRTRGRKEGLSKGLVQVVEDRIYLPTSEVKSKRLLMRLIERGDLILLRDDVANVEVVTAPSIVRRIVERLPINLSDVDKAFSEREYELLGLLNRLGYVLIRDGKYVPTNLINELVE